MRAAALLAFAPCLLLAHGQAMDHAHMAAEDRPVPLVKGLGSAQHRIRTSNPEAQQYFNQGLDYIYAFNHDEARRSFQKAADLDPSAPMPLWGIALAVGPNYNDIDIGHARTRQAMVALEKARSLNASTTPEERAYVHALSTRYGVDAKGDPQVRGPQYVAAMAALAKRNPSDPDAATLYAEALMDLHPWKLWSPDGKPAPGTQRIVATLQGVLRRYPDHVGANHLLIHAVEASTNAGLGTASAQRLEHLAPAAGHLVHMPAHIYQRTGNFDGAAAANERAVQADRAYFRSEHIEGMENMYYIMYYVHNMHFLASSCSMEGNNACTQKSAKELVQQLLPGIEATPLTEWYTPTQPWMLVRFGQWRTILETPLPPSEKFPVLSGMWHYARGCAFAATGKLQDAAREREQLAHTAETLPASRATDFNNPGKEAFTLATLALDARIAEAKGDRTQAISLWQQAVQHWDTLAYNEPPDWYYPVRESLGGTLLRDGKPADAEAVFRKELTVNTGNGRALYGLWQSLARQGHTQAAAKAEAEFHEAWKHADTQLSVDTL